MSDSEIILYQDESGETKIEVRLEDETVWLSLNQMADLFQKAKSTISEHIKNVYDQQELEETATTRKILSLQTEGSRQVERLITLYNFDVIAAVGYRVKSAQGTKFRVWATQRIKEYLLNQQQTLNETFRDLFAVIVENNDGYDKNKSGYVYIIKSPTGYYKIGRTKDPLDRMKTFRLKLPFEVEFTFILPTPDMMQTETALHRLFKEKRINGEWFDLTEHDLEIVKTWEEAQGNYNYAN